MNLQMMMLSVAGGTGPGIDPTTGWSVSSVVPGPGTALAGFEIDADGGIERYNHTGNLGDVGRWDGGSPLNKIDYQFRFDESGPGSVNGASDATNVWLAASAGLNT